MTESNLSAEIATAMAEVAASLTGPTKLDETRRISARRRRRSAL